MLVLTVVVFFLLMNVLSIYSLDGSVVYLSNNNSPNVTKLLSISLPNIDRFSKLFQWHTVWKICNTR